MHTTQRPPSPSLTPSTEQGRDPHRQPPEPGTISNLSYNAVIEANAIIGAGGATPLVIGEMPTRVAGLVNEVRGL